MKRLFLTTLAAGLGLTFATQGCSAKERPSGFGDDPASLDGGDEGGLSFGNDAGIPVREGGLEECAKANAGTTKAPLLLEIVLDGSGSMSGGKWEAAVGALGAVFDSMKTDAANDLAVGLIVFADSKDGSPSKSGPYPSSSDVFPGVVDNTQHRILRERISGSQSGGTPLGAALNGAYSVVENFVVPPGSTFPAQHKKVVVAMSDGEPNETKSTIISTVKSKLQLTAPRGPIQTFSVGIGGANTSGYDASFMSQIAVAGGTENPNCDPLAKSGPNICHFQIEPGGSIPQMQQAFIDTLNRIRALASACELTLESDAARADPSTVNVKIVHADGTEVIVKQDATDGWTYDDPNNPTKVFLHGAACETATKDTKAKVEVVLGCKTIVD